MKTLPLHANNQFAQNHELVKLYLDIGQCRFIHRLLAKEFDRMRQQQIVDKNDALLQLLDQIEAFAYSSSSKPLHVDTSLDDYINSNTPEDINALLSSCHISGALSHE